MPVDEASLLNSSFSPMILVNPRPPPTLLELLLDFQYATRKAECRHVEEEFLYPLSQLSTAETLSSKGEATLVRCALRVHRRGWTEKASLI